MPVAGIIAEYNPFHTGHARHIAQTRAVLGEDTVVVCAMSSYWVQRGDAAIQSPQARAAAALGGGADLVLALPTVWSAASAEIFARGGVGVLAATGAVDMLSFGSEDGTLPALRAAAACLDTPSFSAALKPALSSGISFAAARQRAVRACIGPAADCLSTPNNNLGVEYLRALPQGMAAMTVPRVGAAHDGDELGEFASASALRRLLRAGTLTAAAPYLPAGVPDGLADFSRCERGVLSALRRMTPDDFDRLDGGREGLGRRLYRAVQGAASLDEVFALAKTKRHAHARLRRMVLNAYLGITDEDRPAEVPYLHVLGMTARGRALLRCMKETARVPILTKPAHAARLEGAGARLFTLESRCADLHALCCEVPRPCGLHWREGPIQKIEVSR